MRTSGEALLISALINNEDVRAAEQLGITPDHFEGFKSHYQWMLNYPEQYEGAQPSKALFRATFPDFEIADHLDIRGAVDYLLSVWHRKQMQKNIEAALELMGTDVEAAYEKLTANKPFRTTTKPRSLIGDLSFFDEYGNVDDTIDVPIRTLQRNTGGIGPTQLWYLGARTGEGKSAYLCDWAISAVLQGRRVKFYSLEMSQMEIRGRVHAILANRLGYPNITSFGILHNTIDTHDYKTFVSELSGRPELADGHLDVHTPAEGFVSPGVIAATMSDYDLIIVDHVGLVRPDGGGYSTDDWRVAARVSNSFKELTLGNKVPILAAAQINRDGASGNQPPDLKNLAGTDALGCDADVVVTLRAMAGDVASVFRLPKNRHGHARMKWWCRFDPDIGQFSEITQDQADELQMKAEE